MVKLVQIFTMIIRATFSRAHFFLVFISLIIFLLFSSRLIKSFPFNISFCDFHTDIIRGTQISFLAIFKFYE